MTTLYVIGNGFDLWHGLPTDYASFYSYAEDVLDEMDAYYVGRGHLGTPWHDFENCLGTYDWQLFFDEYNEVDVMSESFRPSELYGLEDELVEKTTSHIEGLRELFQEWVRSIDVSSAKSKVVFEPDSKFLTFNYTNTLQSVYEIAENCIFHIHGSVAGYDELIFGHGVEIEEELELDENGDSNRSMFTDSENPAKSPLYAFKKPVEEIIANNSQYFASLSGVSRIVVIGHSLNDIDIPYFEEIRKSTRGSKWVVYCYRESDAQHYQYQLERCLVSSNDIEFRAYP